MSSIKISVYTFVKNGIYLDFHIVDMLKHHLGFADEIIVNEGYSTDETYNKIKNIDPKIKIYRNKWDTSNPSEWAVRFKNQARKLCSGDWCILLDADEFIPEWQFAEMRSYLTETQKMIIPLKYINFYGNYKVYNKNPKKHNWGTFQHRIHRNIDSVEIWGDGSNIAFKDVNGKLVYEDENVYSNRYFDCHHFGAVRNPARLREKWHHQFLRDREFYIKGRKSKWDWIPSFVYDLFPYNWVDLQYMNDLAIYEGPYIKAVCDNPYEFVRDDFKIYRLLQDRR